MYVLVLVWNLNWTANFQVSKDFLPPNFNNISVIHLIINKNIKIVACLTLLTYSFNLINGLFVWFSFVNT